MCGAVEPEFESVVAFVSFLLDEDRTAFLPGEAQRVAASEHRSLTKVMAELKSYGLTVALNRHANVRGFTTSSHDRFYGPGSEKMHGGSGWEQVTGFAGQSG